MLFFLIIVVLVSIFASLPGVPLPGGSETRLTEDTRNISRCALCDQVVKEVFHAFKSGAGNEQIVDAMAQKCAKLQLMDEQICRGVATIAAPTVRYIYNNSQVIPGNVCGILLQPFNCPLSDPEKLEWSINPSDIPKPEIASFSQSPPGSETLKVLHIADPHWDPEYMEGTNANCKIPLCCRSSSGLAAKPEDAAGYWGDYRSCDMPWRTVETAVAHMAHQHPDVAYIIWTGDIVPHDNWETDREENIMINDRLFRLMKKYFPTTPLYPTLGNHESHPVNTFSPPEITDPEVSTSWLYEDADMQWSQWLNPADVSSTIRHGGYYTTLVRPGLRIVSMNMNYCYTLNWWTLYDSKDPASGLLWLRGVLEKAEMAGEKVHIISHIPPGNDDCWSIFSREFVKLINRFESTVTAQFYGHTHKDEHKIFYDLEETDRPVNVAYVAGSLSSYTNLNPSYRIYTIDGPRPGATWAVTDFSTWYFNLTAANLDGAKKEPVWSELYSAKEEYGLKDLSPSSLHDLLQRMMTDDDLFKLYFKNFHKAADSAVPKGCDVHCKVKLLCPIVTTNFGDLERCRDIKRRLFVRRR